MDLNAKIKVLDNLGRWLKGGPHDEIELAKLKSTRENQWFTPDNLDRAINAVAVEYLDGDKIESWLRNYPLQASSQHERNVAVIAAGNIPMAGLHDLLAVFLSGNRLQFKPSSKDAFLIPALLKKMIELEPGVAKKISIVDKVKTPDAVIATGSSNTARYFEAYFRDIPRIVRKNRNSVAVLDGSESWEDYEKLGRDIYQYFGLGCRSVSYLYVPEEFDFAPMMEYFKTHFSKAVDHTKYQNNYEYNLACSMLNNEELIIGEHLLLFQKDSYLSRIATLNYRHYREIDEVIQELEDRRDQIQCVAAGMDLGDGLESIRVEPGHTQQPQLKDYADGVDTLEFLLSLKK